MSDATSTGRSAPLAPRAIGLLSIALYLMATPVVRAQQDQEEQKGIDQGNYNIGASTLTTISNISICPVNVYQEGYLVGVWESGKPRLRTEPL